MLSLSDFFSLNSNILKLHECLSYSSAACKRSAWYGDSLLSTYLADMLFCQQPELSPEIMSRKKALYAANSSMRRFMFENTDVENRLPTNLSDHTYGTVFEAMLASCFQTNGETVARACVSVYCLWVDQNIELSFDKMHIELKVYVPDSGLFRDITCVSLSDAISIGASDPTTEKSMMSSFIHKAMNATAETKGSNSPATYDGIRYRKTSLNSSFRVATSTTERLSSGHKDQTITQVMWRSCSKQWHSDPYYQCCGVRHGVNDCLRTLWPDSNAQHSGVLEISRAKSGSGSGSYQYNSSYGHIPRGSTPKWSCCGQTSVAPGCKSTLFSATKDYNSIDNNLNLISNEEKCATSTSSTTGITGTTGSESNRESLNYYDQIKSWLKQHEVLVRMENSRFVNQSGSAF